MDEVLRGIVGEHGVFLWREARELGYSHNAIARAVRSGSWRRVRHGAYTFPDAWRSLDVAGRYLLLCRAAYRQSRTPVVLSHTSAVVQLGAPTWGLDLREVDLTRRDGRSGRREAGVRQHRGTLVDGDVVEADGMSLSGPTRAALEITTVVGTEASVTIIDNLLHRGLTTPEALQRRYRLMNAWPHTLHTDLVLRLADGRSESVAESRTRFLCWRCSLPAPVPQYEVRDGSGLIVARLDFAWPGHGVFVEVDGAAKYSEHLRPGETERDVVLREKRREEMVSELTGWLCVRLTWRDLSRGEQTARRISHALNRGRGVIA